MSEHLQGFFHFILGDQTGYFALATRRSRTGIWGEHFFKYPDQVPDAVKFIEKNTPIGDVYFCPTVLREPARTKENVHDSYVLWADLDECPPSEMLVRPTIVIESSPNRYQAYWRLKAPVNALEAEAVNKRIAYAHADKGADKSGWDLTQLLRIPSTNNHKRVPHVTQVKLLPSSDASLKYDLEDFSAYKNVDGTDEVQFEDMPSALELSEAGDAEMILERIKLSVNPRVWSLYETTPVSDWSRNLWQLQLLLIAAGLSKTEVFVVARASACNKYRRDGRPDELLWKEVCRAWDHEHKPVYVPDEQEDELLINEIPPLITDEEREWCKEHPTLIEEYIEWASSIGDAAWQYHQAGGFVILSSLLAGTVRLPTSYGTVLPNLWFMILADTTLTRKTTAMDMAMDLLSEIDPDCVLATDGSIEGLMTAMSSRPGRASIFLRDEFSGLLEMLTKRDYYAGMLETFTKLYDGKFLKRILRKETIEVRDPVLIMFTGGIRERMLQLMTVDHVNSGFIPRFVFITAESDITRLRPLGPPSRETLDQKQELLTKFREMQYFYTRSESDIPLPVRWDAELTDEAWVRYNKIEHEMLDLGLKSNMPDVMTPTMDRLTKSGLKAAVLLAATRMEDRLVVREHDIVRAFYYVEQWRGHTLQVINNIGKTSVERRLEQAYGYIRRRPGIARSKVMQSMHLTAREADLLFLTLEQRGLIRIDGTVKKQKLYPTTMEG